MAELNETSIASRTEANFISNANTETSSSTTILESEPKRFKSDKYENEPSLEERLVGVLCCVVCLDLPNLSFFQCLNGHLMCVSCLSHLLADSHIKGENATCPQCRCEISKTACIRNLAVEKAISELPVMCGFCCKQMSRSLVNNHEKDICSERTVSCTYANLGCHWLGQYNLLSNHETSCTFPKTAGQDILSSITQVLSDKDKEITVYKTIFSLLSSEKVTYNDIQLKPYRTDEYIPKLFYESAKFSPQSSIYQWTVKARVNENQVANPLLCTSRTLSYQLCLKTKLSSSSSISFSYVVMKGPYGEVPISPVVYDYEFTAENQESIYQELPLCGSNDCNKVLSAKTINFRLFLMQTSK